MGLSSETGNASICMVTPGGFRFTSRSLAIQEKNMDAAELRAMQAPIKERYKSDPSAAVITLKAKGSIDSEGIACKVETGRALVTAGLHPATGGSGLELCSDDMLLEALVACAGVKAMTTSSSRRTPRGVKIVLGRRIVCDSKVS